MLNSEMEFARVRGEIEMRRTEAAMTVAELDAMSEALKEQGATARVAGKWVSAMSALSAPTRHLLVRCSHSANKIAAMSMAYGQSASWREVLVSSWTEQDWTILSMILTFWFGVEFGSARRSPKHRAAFGSAL